MSEQERLTPEQLMYRRLGGAVCGKALCIRREDDQETAEAAADELGSWVARKVAQRDARIVELEAQVAAFRAPAEAAGYTVSADGKCWTGNGGGREFFQGPPINVTHGEEPETVDHLAEAQERDDECPLREDGEPE